MNVGLLKTNFNFMAPFMDVAIETLSADSLLFNTQSSGVPGTHLINLGIMRG